MNQKLMYVERKSGGHRGCAWIGLVSFSRTGATLFFNGRAHRSLKGSGISGNYADIETGEEFWISGVKKRGTNRHQFGGGAVFVDRAAVSALLQKLATSALDPASFVVSDAEDTTARRISLHHKENEPITQKRRSKPVQR